MADLTGQTLGIYHLDSRIGVGEHGEAYRATDTRQNLQVAVKVVTAPDDDAAFGDYFLEVMRQVAGLSHANIVQVYDAGTVSDLCYIAMQYQTQGSLRTWMQLRRSDSRNRSLQLLQGLEYMQQMARGLDYAHAKGLVHRALKPENLLIAEPAPDQRLCRIADFGMSDVWARSHQTRTNTTLGVYAYLAPEQLAGLPVDTRADIYALGAMFYEIATGCLPFEIKSLDDALNSITKPLQPPTAIQPDVPSEIENIIVRCLERKAEDRPASASDVAKVVQSSLDGLRHSRSAPSPEELPTQILSKGVKPQPTPVVVPLQKQSFKVSFESDGAELVLVPGQSRACYVNIGNLTDRLDAYTLTLDGVPQLWLRNVEAVERKEFEVNPGGELPVPLTLQVPRDASSHSGQYKVAIKVRSRNTGETKAIEALWVVERFLDCSLNVDPTTMAGRLGANYVISLRNTGNQPERFKIAVTQSVGNTSLQPSFIYKDQIYDPNVSALKLDRDTERTVTMRVRVSRRHWLGASKPHMMVLSARPENGETLKTKNIEYIQLPMFSVWLLALLITVVSLGGVFGVWLAKSKTSQTPVTLAVTVFPSSSAAVRVKPPTVVIPPATRAVATAVAPLSFDGVWQTNFAMLSLSSANGIDFTGRYVLLGSSDSSGTQIQGKLNGVRLEGINPVPFVFTLQPDGSFTGRWERGTTSYPWCGVRGGPLPMGCGFSGRWVSDKGEFPTIVLTQTATSVEGVLLDQNGSSIGKIDGVIGNDGSDSSNYHARALRPGRQI